MSAFALWLGAGGPVLGLVSALPTASTALAQSFARRLEVAGLAARRVVARCWSAQAVALAALGACAYLPPSISLALLCALIVAGWGSGGLAVPAWTRLVSDTVSRERHGWFFGLRTAAQQIGVVTAILGGGSLLALFGASGRERLGFALLFFAAGISRALGTALLARVDTHVRDRARPRASGLGALKASRQFRRLALYLWALHFGTHAATPFFVPYMLSDLGFSYLQVAALLTVPALTKIGTVRAWGRLADRIGPGTLLRGVGWLVAPVPALWLISGSPWWILAAQLCSGLAWGAFEVAQAAALLQTTRGRANAVGVFNLIDGGAILGGSLLGGIVVHVATAHGHPGYLVAMAASAALRTLAAAVLLFRVREIGRPTWPIASIPLRLWGFRPTRGFSLRPWGEEPLRPADEEPPGPES